MKYYTKEEFMDKTNNSRSTIDRFYRENLILAEERIKKGKRKNIPETHLKYFSWELLFEEEKTKDKKISELQKVIALARETTLGAVLWKEDWKWIGTISYRHDFSKDSCYNKMQMMYKELQAACGKQSDLKLFFTTEAYSVRDGHHSHFVLDCHPNYRNLVKTEVKKMFKKDRVDLRLYDPTRAWLFYITKDGLQGEDWDYVF
jgi:predicted glycosyl hydrolase (DUF1957 family)